MVRQITSILGDGPYPLEVDSLAFREAIDIHIAPNVSLVRPRTPLLNQDEAHAHAHDSYEFTISLSDSPLLRQDNHLIRLPAGNMLCCNPNVLHGPAQRITNANFLAIQIRRGFLQRLSQETYHKSELSFSPKPFKPPRELLRLFNHFIDESQSRRTGHELILNALEVQIAIHFLRFAPHGHRAPNDKRTESRKNIARAIEILHAHFTEPFSADTLAEFAGMSRHHFFRAFKAHTGRTPYEFLTEIRVQKAMEMLSHNALTITEICYKTGFSGHSHFTSVFHKKTGMVPRDYRVRHQSGKSETKKHAKPGTEDAGR